MSLAVPVWLLVQEQLLGNGVPDCGSPTCFDDYNDEALFELFHLTKPCIAFITDSIRLNMKTVAMDRAELSVDAQVMVALNYYAHGVFSGVVLDTVGLRNQSERAYVIVDKLSGVLVGMSDHFVSLPETPEAKACVASKIKKLSGIPNALGILAPAHFKIGQSPHKKSPMSDMNGLDHASVVSQVICDSDGNLLSAEKFRLSSGSTFEPEKWELPSKGKDIEELQTPHWVIGSKDYQLSKYVLTPVTSPVTEGEIQYNKAHEKLDDIMQMTLSNLKRRFRCLLQLGHAQETTLKKNSDIIKACSVLHNISLKFSVPPPPAAGEMKTVVPTIKQHEELEICPEALKARQKVIDEFFSSVSMETESAE